MSRLITYDKNQKRYFHKFSTDGFDTLFQKVCAKLYAFEDLEDELGYPLDVVFKAIKNGVHIKIDDEEIDIEGWKLSIYLKEQCFIINEMLFKTKLPFSDYGKTWWLKGDRSDINGS